MFSVATTTAGKIEGVLLGGVHQFRGVPYGAPTGGPNRFRPPQPPVPWAGVRECFGYGAAAPQPPVGGVEPYLNLIQLDLVAAWGGLGEDCLNLNIWSPGLGDSARRPILVCIHGGGYGRCSGNMPMYDGANLARLGDVVVVSVNHRLGLFGYLDVGGDEAQSGVAGMLDLVAALEWIRDNAEAFGGDAGNVTIFGQSGGGAKVTTLLAMPSARGLFHRAGIQSGSLPLSQPREQAAQTRAAVLSELGLSSEALTDLQALPWQALLAVQAKLGDHLFTPVIDGEALPLDPFDPVAEAAARDIPLMISTTLDDASLFFGDFDLTEDGLIGFLGARYPDSADEILALYRGRYPTKSPALLRAQIITDAGFRRLAIQQAERRAEAGGASVHMYQWDWTPPGRSGALFGAGHAVDVAATMNNPREPIMGGLTPETERLTGELAQAWIAFARTGSPGWPDYEATRRETMVFDTATRAERDPGGELRAYWAGVATPPTLFG